MSLTSCLRAAYPPSPTEIDALYRRLSELRENFRQQEADYVKASKETWKVKREEREEEVRRRKAVHESRRMKQ